MSVTEDLSGKKFGDLTVIGDTGKRTKSGNQIVIARHEDGRIIESTSYNIKKGITTGLIGSDKNREHLKVYRDMYQYINLKEGTNLSLLTQKPRTASGYRGVYWSSKKKAWNVKVGLKSKIVFNNHFTSFSEAVLKRMELEEKYYNPILIKYGLPVIPRPDIIKNDFVLKKEKERKKHLSNPLGRNKYRHVSFDKVRQKYVVQMRVNGKQKGFGRFENLEDALKKREEVYKKYNL